MQIIFTFAFRQIWGATTFLRRSGAERVRDIEAPSAVALDFSSATLDLLKNADFVALKSA